jgi:hypothetical protein
VQRGNLGTVIAIWQPIRAPLRLRGVEPVAAMTEEDVAFLL